MNVKLEKFLQGAMFVLLGVLFAFILSAVVRPQMNDNAHAIGIINAQGGSVVHPVEYEMSEALFGKFTLLLTAKVLPPVSGDFVLNLVGPEELEYAVTTRYPPGVPLYNRSDRWYTFEESIFKGVTTGSDMVIGLRISAPKDAGAYSLSVSDNSTGQIYLNLPIFFTDGENAAATEDECH